MTFGAGSAASGPSSFKHTFLELAISQGREELVESMFESPCAVLETQE